MERNVSAEQTISERELEIASESAYAEINNRYSDMRNKNLDSAGQMPPSDAAELGRADAMDLAKISKAEIAAKASDLIAYNMANSPDYKATVERTLNELESTNAPNAALARESVEQGKLDHTARQEQIELVEQAEAKYQQWSKEQRAEDPQRTDNLQDPEKRAEFAASGTDQAAEVRAANNAAIAARREHDHAVQARQISMTDDEKRAEFATNDPEALATLRAQTDAAIAARLAEAKYQQWAKEQRAEDPQRTDNLQDPEKRAEFAASGTDKAAEVRAANNAAIAARREHDHAVQARQISMTDDEKRAEFATNDPEALATLRAQTDAAIAARLAEAKYQQWAKEQRTEDPQRSNNLRDDEMRAEFAASGTDKAAEVRTANDAAISERRSLEHDNEVRRMRMTDDEKRAEFATNDPEALATLRAQTDAAIAARQSSVQIPEVQIGESANWAEAVNNARALHHNFKLEERTPDYSHEMAATDIAAVAKLEEVGYGPDAIQHEDKTFALEQLQINAKREMNSNPDFRAYMEAHAPETLKAQIEAVVDPYAPKQAQSEAGTVNAPADARVIEQEMDRQLDLNEGERQAEKEAVSDADLASVRSDNDAAIAARAVEQDQPEAEVDPFGPPLEEVATKTAGDARSIEQEMDRQLELNEGERLAEKEAVSDEDLASVRSANDAAIAARAVEQAQPEAEVDPFGPALDDAPQQAPSEQDVANMIEPVSIREAVNDPAIPVKDREAANAPENGEEIVLDEQTRAHLARARAADRTAAEQQLGHTDEDRRPAQQPEKESATPEFTDRRSRDNQVSSDEIMTANRETRKPVLPPEIERQYVSVGTKYYDQKKPDVVAFEDKGNRLETRSNNEEVAANLVKIAESRGWDEIKVSGSETFRKEVWQEAASRGMKVKGYTPSEQDKASLAARMQTREANKVEQVKTQEKAAVASPEKQRAESFQKDSREVALKKHPELAGAYAAQAAMQKKMDADRLSPEQQAVVKARVNKNIVNSIEAGKIPEVNRREEVTKHREVTEEREQTR